MQKNKQTDNTTTSMIKKAVVDSNTPSIMSGRPATKSCMDEPLTDDEKLNKDSFIKLSNIV